MQKNSPQHTTSASAFHGVTLVELIVTLAIFAAVSAVLISSFITLFAIRGQSNATQGAYDDVRVVFDTMERELQNAIGEIRTTCSGGVCRQITFDIQNGDITQTIGYRKQTSNNFIEKAVESFPVDTANNDACANITVTSIDARCWQPITGSSTQISVLHFQVVYPASGEVQESPLVSIGLKGYAVDDAGSTVDLGFSSTINPRNKIHVDQVLVVDDTDVPLITFISVAGAGSTGGLPCNGLYDNPAFTPPPITNPADGQDYYTLCGDIDVEANGLDDTGMLYLQLSKDGALHYRETITGGATNLTFTFSGIALDIYERDTITVRAVDIAGNSDEQTFTVTRGAAAAPPGSVTVGAPSGCAASGVVPVSWGAAALAETYEVQSVRTSDGNTITRTVSAPTLSLNFPLADGQVHTFRVRALNPLGPSGWTNSPGSVTAPPASCIPSFRFSAYNSESAGNIDFEYQGPTTPFPLRWWSIVNAQNGCAVEFPLPVSGGTWSGAKSNTGDNTVQIQPTALGTYVYNLTCRGTDNTPTSINRTVRVMPRAPQNVTADAGSCGGRINVSWTPSPGATDYTVSYRYQPPAPFSPNNWSTPVAVAGTTYEISGLTLNEDYQIVVRARGGGFTVPATTLTNRFASAACQPKLTVCPTSPTVNVGQTVQLQARYWDNLASVPDCSTTGYTNVSGSASWSSSNASLASVSSSTGLVTGVAAGTPSITAGYLSLSAPRTVTVSAPTACPVGQRLHTNGCCYDAYEYGGSDGGCSEAYGNACGGATITAFFDSVCGSCEPNVACTPPPDKANLYTSDPIELASGTLTNGSTVTFRAISRNGGTQSTGSGFTNSFSYRWSGYSSVVLSDHANAALGVGAWTQNTSAALVLNPPVGVTQFDVLYLNDRYNNVDEIDEVNNTMVTSFTISAPTTYALTVTKSPTGGTVLSNPAGINCGISCGTQSTSYTNGTNVSLTGSIANGRIAFSNGECVGTDSCTTTMTAARSVLATISCNAGYTFSGGSCVVSGGTPPATPTGLAASPAACGTGQVNVSWNSVSGATSYQLRNSAGTVIYSGAATSSAHTGLSAGSAQSYTVRATNANGSSVYSGSVGANAPSACAVGSCTRNGVTQSSGWTSPMWCSSGQSTYGVMCCNGTWKVAGGAGSCAVSGATPAPAWWADPCSGTCSPIIGGSSCP